MNSNFNKFLCTKCSLHETRTNLVWGKPNNPNPPGKIMLVGEAPGEQEDLQGLPFVGRSGKILEDALSCAFNHEYFWNKIYITNIVKCRPPGNRNPTKKEMQACYPHFKYQCASLLPEVIVALGKVSAEFILQRSVKITKEHGQYSFINEGTRETTVLICYHPAYVLRNTKPEISQAFYDTIRDAKDKVYGVSSTQLYKRSPK